MSPLGPFLSDKMADVAGKLGGGRGDKSLIFPTYLNGIMGHGEPHLSDKLFGTASAASRHGTSGAESERTGTIRAEAEGVIYGTARIMGHFVVRKFPNFTLETTSHTNKTGSIK